MATALGVVTPHLRATWRHEFADSSETAIANFVVLRAVPLVLTSSRLGRDCAVLGACVTAELGRGFLLSAEYRGEVGRDNETVHQLALSARIAF